MIAIDELAVKLGLAERLPQSAGEPSSAYLLRLLEAAEPILRARGTSGTCIWRSTPSALGGFWEGAEYVWDASSGAWRNERGGPPYPTVAYALGEWHNPYDAAFRALSRLAERIS